MSADPTARANSVRGECDVATDLWGWDSSPSNHSTVSSTRCARKTDLAALTRAAARLISRPVAGLICNMRPIETIRTAASAVAVRCAGGLVLFPASDRRLWSAGNPDCKEDR